MKNKENFTREHLNYLKKERNKKIIITVSRILILVLIIGIWELCAQVKLIDPFITSSPSRVIKTIGDLAKNGTLFYHIGITLGETIAGFAIAVVLGYSIAVLLWESDSAMKRLEP